MSKPEQEVDRHFSRSGHADQEGLRARVAASPEARRRYGRWLILARLDPKLPSAKDRIAASLGLEPARRPAALPWRSAGLVLAGVAAVCVALWLRPATLETDDGFSPRGSGGPSPATVEAFVVSAGAPPRPLGAALNRGDELAFAYRSPAEAPYLLVFAVDEHRHVYWFHPAWTDPAQVPGSVHADSSGALVELPEAIAHRYDGRVLTLYGFFSVTPRTVVEVEKALAEGTPLTRDPRDVLITRSLLLEDRR